jgi:hypothetical protein
MRGFGGAPNGVVVSDPRLSDSVVSLSGVSHSEFAEVFASEQECVSATLEEGIARLSKAVSEGARRGVIDAAAWREIGDDAAEEREERWLAEVRAALVGLLGFLDDEPAWGWLLFVHAPDTGAMALDGVECERRVLGVLAELLGRGSYEPSVGGDLSQPSALVGELVMSGMLAAIRVRLVGADGRRMVELAPSLTAFVAGPYLQRGASQVEPIELSPPPNVRWTQ